MVYGETPYDLKVNWIKDIGVARPYPGRALLLAGLLVLGACATQNPTNLKPPPLLNAGPEIQVADVDVLAVSPAMDEFLERYILNYSNPQTRANLLMNAISGNGVLGFDYDETFTLTSTDAFEAAAGNCIGFSNMFIALARRAGLKAKYQEVFRRPEWSTREETVLLIKHINVKMITPGYSYVVDVSGIRIEPNAPRRIIGDSYAKALYFNNIGAEALINNDLPTAWAYMAKAIETEPLLTDSWVNMGVVLGRNEQLQDAAHVLRKALQIDPSEHAALSNLYEVYIAMEDFESASQLEGKVERYRQKNPYYLLQLSEEALIQDNHGESLRLLKRAIRINENDHQLHFALAVTQYLSGDIEAAAHSLLRARELAPPNMIAHYDRPLGELVTEAEIKRNMDPKSGRR